MVQMTTKERIKAVAEHREVDHLPFCVDTVCHGMVSYIDKRYPDPFQKALYYKELGLDTGITLHYPAGDIPEVAGEPPMSIPTRQWKQGLGKDDHLLLFKEYRTPAGNLRQVVRKTEDYPGDSIRLFSDHNVPAARSLEYLVKSEDDLDALEHLFKDLLENAVKSFYQDSEKAREFCNQHGLILSAYSLGVGDPIAWMSGVERALMMAMTEEEAFRRYVGLVSDWNRKILELAIDAGADHIVRRGWYESTDFWSPDLYEEFLFQPLKKEIALAHDAGVTVAYVMASGAAPLLGYMEKAEVDIYSNIDPLAPNTNLRSIRERIGDSVALCGGLNNYDILEQGSEEEVEQAVREAIDIFSPPTGCILAPSDSLFLGDPKIIERNFHVMINTWKETVLN